MSLQADRRRALDSDPGVSATAEFSGTIRNSIIIQEGTEMRGLYPRYESVRVLSIPCVLPGSATIEKDVQRPPQSLGALKTGH